MKVDDKLIKKYSITGPRYTSYPPATFFDNNFSNDDFQRKIIAVSYTHLTLPTNC